ncbi:DUF2325 domain-containing protein [Thiocapsa roseopersicina]|uniref:DUF2325 domain-containing protein n=1 Tax=Thiocapsa roseopersicina TaxID=1058 RepID=A0A1H2RMV5_THIRO|nr:DUF2325 domain-containing protein [Thiocapsa roseopersicina]SDW20094.1 hypothetical protein SAMN05421783_10275 [Thiocapsa roseopersicina]
MQRLIFEVSDQAARLAIYDFESQELLAEVEGSSWHRMLEELRIGSGPRKQTCCAHHAEVSTDEIIRRARPAQKRLSQALFPETDTLAATPIALSRSPSTSISAAASAAAFTELSGPSSRLPILKTTGRRKLWDVPHKYHCPIIGTCLTVDELRRIADRTAQRPDTPLSEFDIHVSFVAAAAEKNPLSLATHKILEKKFAASVRRYTKARDADALLTLWSESLATGDVPGGFWALMTHSRADQRVMTRAYEEIHMLSHQIGAGQRADLKRLTETRTQLERLQRDFDQLHTRTRQQADLREARIRTLETALARRESDYAESRAQEQALREQLDVMKGRSHHERIKALVEQVADLDAELERIREENAILQDAGTQARHEADAAECARRGAQAECRATERLLEHLLSDRCDGCTSESCVRPKDLAGRLVLCVGGRKQLVEQYRAMVAGCNGRFDHHDGGMEDSQHRLEAMLASADIVVCATDYVSHGAYYRTKRFCKRTEKPYALLGNSGLSSFALAIEKLAA